MDYFVKKHIKKNLIIKIISECLSLIILLSYFFYLGGGYSPAPIFWILIIFCFSISFIINLHYLKKEDYNSFTLPLSTNIFLFFIEIMSILFTDWNGDIEIIFFSGFISLILISIGICVNIQMILLKPEKQNLIIQKIKEEEKEKQRSFGTSFTADSKKRLFGMIKLKKTLDIKETSEKLGLPEGEIENLLFDLAGENKISGNFKEGIFHITSDVDEFIGQLDDIFSEWGDNEKTKHMKI